MFDRVTLRVADLDASARFYATVLAPLGFAPSTATGPRVAFGEFELVQTTADTRPTSGLHLGFVAADRAAVDAFWRAGVDAGHPDDGRPGPRPQYSDAYYGGFLRDPDGNSAEAVHDEALRVGGIVDHLWLRTRDLARVRDDYHAIAARAGFRLALDTPERIRFGPLPGEDLTRSGGSLTFVAGEPPTTNVELLIGGVAITHDDAGAAPDLP